MFIYSDTIFCFFNDPATPEIYTLSLHDALPIYLVRSLSFFLMMDAPEHARYRALVSAAFTRQQVRHIEEQIRVAARSEEHTSELQSRQYLVCRLLLEKKNKKEHRRK